MDYKRYSIRAVLFEVSYKSISCKPLSLMKIENSLLLFYLIPEAATEGILWKIGFLIILAKTLKKSVKEIFLVKLRNVGHNRIKNQFLPRYILQILLKFW